MKPIAYSIAYLPGLLAMTAMYLGGWWLWTVPALIFLLVPAVELFIGGSARNSSDAETQNRKTQRIFEVMVYGIVPVHLTVVSLCLWQISQGVFSGWDWVGAVFSVGICCGMYGLNVGHELGHRSNKAGRFWALVLMSSSLYPHFLLEHNRGHHRRVATPEDPASARRGEWLYAFWFRSVIGGARSAWSLDKAHVIRVWASVGGVWLAVLFLLGPLAAVSWLAAGLVGIGLLETVNYIEHYGLQRQRKANGRYERTRPCHSWNANHPLGRVLLFDLTRHSDHHAYPGRRYQVLRSHEDAPLLPSGYPGLILLALCPPLFFAVMHPHLRREHQRLNAA